MTLDFSILFDNGKLLQDYIKILVTPFGRIVKKSKKSFCQIKSELNALT